jgi:transcriptional regulator with XRE-family HTH domain
MSQAEFARRLGVGRSTLIRYEANTRVPDADLLLKLWVAFKADTLWLLTGIRATDSSGLSADEERLLFLFRACQPACQQHLIVTSEFLAGLPMASERGPI